MRTVATRLLAAVGIGAAVVCGSASPTIPARFDFAPISAAGAAMVLGRSTVQIQSFGCDLERRDGTAVVVGRGRLVTNAHVVSGSRLIDVVADGLPTLEADPPAVAAAGDLASVTAGGVTLPAMALSGADAPAGASVRMAGYPSGPTQPVPGLLIVDARVLGYAAGGPFDEPWPVMRLSVPARPGMSGGPVLDQSGRLAGILFGNEVPTGQALAIPVSALRKAMTATSFARSAC